MQNKAKILILFTSGYPIKKYAEPYLAAEMPYLSAVFDKVYVVPIRTDGEEIVELPANAELLKLGNQQKFNFNVYTTLFAELPKLLQLPGKLSKIRYYRALLSGTLNKFHELQKKLDFQELVKNNHITLYSYWYSQVALIPCFLKKKYPMLPFITRGHGFDVFEEQNLFNYIPFRRFQLKYTDRVLSVSQRGMQYLKQKFPAYSDKIGYSYLGSPDKGLGHFDTSQPFTIVTCSYIRNVKRLELMAGILNCLDFEVNWLVIGNGEDMEKLREANQSIRKNINISYLGSMANSDILNLYKTTSINLLVSLSSSEGLPVSMMEAQSFGIPIMSTDVGGCSEICNAKTGFLIQKEFDPSEAANRIVEFKNSKKNTMAFRIDCRKNWEKKFNALRNYTDFADKIAVLQTNSL